MNSFIFVDKRKGYLVAAFALVVAFIVPALAFAAQVTERSIALSSASAGATGVEYTVNFTPEGAAGAFVVDFCNDSPLIGATCTQPAGMVVTGADSATSGVTDVTGAGHQIIVTKPLVADEAQSVVVTGITNPTSAGPLYARIVTFADAAAAADYTSTDPDNDGATPYIDNGGVAMSITPTIGVSGAVLESMTFCVSGAAIDEGCTGTLTAPVLKLGATVGGVVALDSSQVYTGVIQTQISTNAAAGAIVSLKSGAASCGGLIRAGATAVTGCGITPNTTTTDIVAGEAKFGLKTGTAAAAGDGENSSGTLRPYDSGTGAFYSSSVFRLNYVGTNATGITSTYGDPVLDTNGAPVNNMGMPLTFGASAANDTAAGLYSADLSLIATGKF